MVWLCRTGTVVKRISRVILFLSYKLRTVWFSAEAAHASAFLFSQSALPYLLKTAEKRCFYTFTWIYNPLFRFIIEKIFSTFFEKNFYKTASLFPISEGVILARAPSGDLENRITIHQIHSKAEAKVSAKGVIRRDPPARKRDCG